MPEVGSNFPIRWNERRQRIYKNYLKRARRRGLERESVAGNLTTALRVALKDGDLNDEQ